MKYYEKPEPATVDDILKWEEKFSILMPSDLRSFLLDSDGPILYEESSQKELQFLSINDAIDYYEEYQFPLFCSNTIPILMDGCGNFAVYKLSNESIQGIYAMSSSNLGWDDSVFLCDDIDTLIKMDVKIDDTL